ncbi:transglycosylase SLT domain-containing protein [Oceanospirillum sediminis]|uniref:Transglycosylase SLT domain-containing protein n=1 Tax=Oceanospirillum sediminis TaxID=2760088 RepID=A0A839IQ74_9GAMM|nr:transglycosylase SLT domain-containing protein [Oceanospirillum sediminis]MBB1487653.1 transglycosylase SLT domain-containing protein [Oceanospirillum sediminis]
MPASLFNGIFRKNTVLTSIVLLATLSSGYVLSAEDAAAKSDTKTTSATSDKKQTEQLEQQRKLYQQAMAAIKKKKLADAKRIYPLLEGYPLQVYLQTEIYSLDLNNISAEEIDRFILENKQLPPVSRLQQRWLSSLAARKDWSGYLKAYQSYPVRGNHYRCLNLKAALNSLKKKQKIPDDLMRDISGMWQQGYSQPDSCNSVFKRWLTAGGMNSQLAETRFWNAVEERDFKLARYAQTFIKDRKAQQDAEMFWKVRTNPARYLKKGVFEKENSHHNIIVTYAVRRMAGKQLEEAARRWLIVREDVTMSDSRLKSLNEYFGIRLSANFVKDADLLTAQLDPEFLYPEVTEWRIRLALAAQNWQLVSDCIDRLPDELKMSSRWAYWQAVAAQHLTGSNQTLSFARIAKDRSYYGFLASDQLGVKFTMNYEKANIPEKIRQDVAGHDAVLRMKELIHHNHMYYARAEWSRLFKTLDLNGKHALAYLADEWKWHSVAIYGAAKIRKWNDLDIRFPVQYFGLYQKHTEKSGIPLNWALSITRKESAFNPVAQSGVGARGLMQLMPRTARSVAKRIKQPYKGKQQLYNPDINIALGTAYLAQMKERFGSRIYATAAYNAGPHRVKKWLAERGDLPLDIWIEVIPFKETRSYVQSVLEFGVVYDVLSSREPHFMLKEEQQMLVLSQLQLAEEQTPEAL